MTTQLTLGRFSIDKLLAIVVCLGMLVTHVIATAQTNTSDRTLIELTDTNGCKLYYSVTNTTKSLMLGRVSGAICENGTYQGPVVYGLSWVSERPGNEPFRGQGIQAGILVNGRFDGLNIAIRENIGAFLVGVPRSQRDSFPGAMFDHFARQLPDIKAAIDELAPVAGGRSPAMVATHLKSTAERWASQREQMLRLAQPMNAAVDNPNWIGGTTAQNTPSNSAASRDDPKVVGGGARPR